jgi:ribonuclease VapC
VIVDSSALVAIVKREPGHEVLVEKLAAPSANAGIGTPTLVEAGLVLMADVVGDIRAYLRGLLEQYAISEIPFVDAHWPVAIEAHRRYGRGRHDARLNFGDCLTYAVARLSNQPLLFVGTDFAKTDLQIA